MPTLPTEVGNTTSTPSIVETINAQRLKLAATLSIPQKQIS
jgi:hypothetical protein